MTLTGINAPQEHRFTGRQAEMLNQIMPYGHLAIKPYDVVVVGDGLRLIRNFAKNPDQFIKEFHAAKLHKETP